MANIFNADDGAISGSAGIKLSSDTSGVLNIQTNGVTAISIAANQVVSFPATVGINFNGQIQFEAGTALIPAISTVADTNTGIYFPGADQIAISTGGTQRLLVDSVGTTLATGVLTVPAGTVTVPSITTTGDSNTGIFFPAADTIAFTEGGVEALRINSSANVGIGTSSPAAKLDIGSGNLNFSSTAQRITGDFSNGTIANRVHFQTTTADSATTVGIIPNGTSANSTLSLESAASATNCSTGQFAIVGGTDVRINSFARGSGTVLPLAFWIGGSERMRLDSSGNLGLGVTPDGNNLAKTFELQQGFTMFGFSNTSYLSANAYYNSGWKYKSTAAAAYYEMSGANGHQWSVANSGTAGNAITFTTALTLNANGNLVLQGGNTVANGVGVTFPATQSASSNANTLDDYEEGTWTPTIIGQTTNPTVTYSIRVGYYTKIGRVVSINGIVLLSAYSGGSGVVYISGLPFTVANDSQNFPVGPIGQMSGFTSGFGDVDGQSFVIRGDAGTTNMSILESRTTTTYDWTVGNLSATFLARFSLVYNT